MRLRVGLAVIGLACGTQHPTPTANPAPTGSPANECDGRIADYLQAREALNHCERDDDCAVVWPGLCPQGPYYVGSRSDVPSVLALENRIADECDLPNCEPPMALEPGKCEAKRCVKGRPPPKNGPMEACWWTDIDFLENGQATTAETHALLQGITPLMAFGAPADGKLVVDVVWPKECDGCQLDVSEHNSGMSMLVEGTRIDIPELSEGPPGSTRVERISLPATKGLYFFLARGANPARVRVTASFITADGAALPATHHGDATWTLCEG